MFHKKAKKELRKLCLKMRMAENKADNRESYELLKEFKLCYGKCQFDKSYDGICCHYNFL